MYSKDELSDKNTSELQDIATGLGLNVQDYTNNEKAMNEIANSDYSSEFLTDKQKLKATRIL